MKPSLNVSGSIILMVACVYGHNARWAFSADRPEFIGRSSCATATCHGGLVGHGPAWHSSSSVWESCDPHLRAGDVLWSLESRQIVAALEKNRDQSPSAYMETLSERCVSCHAPEAQPLQSLPGSSAEVSAMKRALSAGVSCEACHGPASNWERTHTGLSWNTYDRFLPMTGMLDTESPLARTDNCSRCHLGSRTADGQIRDMNHDMIAAGHPALYFDMWQLQRRLPPHWDTASDALASADATMLLKKIEALRMRGLLAAIRLSDQRRIEDQRAPQPELSEFDCGACHHAVQSTSLRNNRQSIGTTNWQPWYTAGILTDGARGRLRMDQPSLAGMIQELQTATEKQSTELIKAPPENPQSTVRELLENLPDARIDYCGAAAWLDQMERALTALSDSHDAIARDQLMQRLQSFRRGTLGQSVPPTSLEILIPRAWEQASMESLGKEISSLINIQRQRGSQ